jgi:iron complex outermembrane receptor protein
MHRIRLMGSCGLLTLTVVLAGSPVLAQQTPPETLPEIVVSAPGAAKPAPAAKQLASPLGAFTLTGEPIERLAPSTNDTAALLTAIPGVEAASGGGVSSLPVLRGLAGDRINVVNFGMAITAFCANHMNPPLSYAEPTMIGSVEVLSGVTPVSKGGDSIAGSIIVERKKPTFASGDGIETHGWISGFYRSNGNGIGGSLGASVADREWNLEYTGSWSKSDNLKAGGDGGTIRSTEYEAQNHLLTLSKKTDGGVFSVSGGYQNIPRQAYPNAWMDMIYNRSGFVNVAYEGAFDWGRLDAKAYWRHTEHYMNFLDDKPRPAMNPFGMPMYTRGDDAGWSIKGTIDLTARDILRLGNEFHHAGLDDWWPAVPGSKMMGPNTYVNINGGRRDRIGNFAEWEHVWSKEWKTLLGGRIDVVDMDTGDVQAYGMMGPDPAAAAAFNARDHHKTDVNFDLTALARWTPDPRADIEFGYARKTRSPNLYERYAWGTGGMSSRMTGWFGDGNGYIGNLDLKPEVAHTVSTTFGFHDPASKAWSVTVTPYLSYVENYIDADRVVPPPGWDPNLVQLKFANHDALLYGFDASAKTALWSSATWGDFGLAGRLAYTHGKNLDTRDGLYRIMPLSGAVTLDHRLGDWTNAFTVKLVAAKTDVSATRLERPTPGYALLDWKTGYRWKNVTFDVGVDNILDKKYALPLGGLNIVDYRWYGQPLRPLLGTGRTAWAGLKVAF